MRPIKVIINGVKATAAVWSIPDAVQGSGQLQTHSEHVWHIGHVSFEGGGLL